MNAKKFAARRLWITKLHCSYYFGHNPIDTTGHNLKIMDTTS